MAKNNFKAKNTVTLAILLFTISPMQGCKFKRKSRTSSAASHSNDTFENSWKIAKLRLLNSAQPLIDTKGQQIKFGFEKEGSTQQIFKVATYTMKVLYLWMSTYPNPNTAARVLNLMNNRDFLLPGNESNIWDAFKSVVALSAKGESLDPSSEAWQMVKKTNNLDHSKKSLESEISHKYLRQFSILMMASAEGEKSFYNLVPLEFAKQHIAGFQVEANGTIWEANFQPAENLAQFEERVLWFRQALERKVDGETEPYSGPGHVWISTGWTSIEEKETSYINTMRLLLFLDGVLLKTGIEKSKYNQIGPVYEFQNTDGRAALRVMPGKFQENDANLVGWEFRTGMKTDEHRAKILDLFLPRAVTHDFSTTGKVFKSDWPFFDFPQHLTLREKEALLNSAYQLFGLNKQTVNPAYVSGVNPVTWRWPEVFHGTYSQLLQRTQQEYARRAPALLHDLDALQRLTRQWVRASGVAKRMEEWLEPPFPQTKEDDFLFRSQRKGKIDVNSIDLGLELTAQFPLRSVSELDDFELKEDTGKSEWIQTIFTMYPNERKAFLEDLAKRIQSKLGGSGNVISQADILQKEADGHGHGIVEAFEFRDGKNRGWHVEWDGVGRSYDPSGKIIPTSERGGHIEVVTPKFVPSLSEINAVFQSFQEVYSVPSRRFGGGHINIDLAPFDGNAPALARFIALFHEIRDIMTLLFQSPQRYRSAEPLWPSGEPLGATLIKELANFKGNADELKIKLYDSKYFNSREGRKTQYTQLNLTAYFQDVVPARFITANFDLFNPDVPWRQTFDVNPLIRKMEFRLFDAPRDPYELAHQIRFVRAMLDFALNGGTGDIVTGQNAPVQFHQWVQNPQATFERFQAVMQKLGLNFAEYEWLFWKNLADVDTLVKDGIEQMIESRLSLNPKRQDWGNALKSGRAPSKALFSSVRPFDVYGKGDSVAETPNARLEQLRKAYQARVNLSTPVSFPAP